MNNELPQKRESKGVIVFSRPRCMSSRLKRDIEKKKNNNNNKSERNKERKKKGKKAANTGRKAEHGRWFCLNETLCEQSFAGIDYDKNNY